MFKITDFKIYRLWWLLFGIPYCCLLVYYYIEPREPMTISSHLSSMVSNVVALSVIFYAIGMKVGNRIFWKIFLPFAFIEEHYNILEDLDGTWDEFVVPNLIVSLPFIALYFYAYQRKEIWCEKN